MLCFRVGCQCAGKGPGSVRVEISIGTRGTVGVSEAVVALRFCSLQCFVLFCEEHKCLQAEILEDVMTLAAVKNKPPETPDLA